MAPVSCVEGGDPAICAADVARGVTRMLLRHDLVTIPEVPLEGGRRADLMAIDAQLVAGPVPLRRQIACIMGIGRQRMRDAFDHRHARRFQSRDLGRIVGQQPHGALPQQRQHPRRHAEIARVDRKAQPRVGIDRIEPLIL
ncbi:hypothetical protein WR25_16636 [Diploscapter pachys]|uniref:Uncharacterized protein n=1 Tax=Diploscapter pachys TaxID=2018661 RepID=A0A2A2KGK5_9BILA|nr:hypothetical protein WR25_16636 [Diploscapter pachys]